jgi:hypothetical protein
MDLGGIFLLRQQLQLGPEYPLSELGLRRRLKTQKSLLELYSSQYLLLSCFW